MLYFANELEDELALRILNSGGVQSSEEARHLSKFFWRMVDKSIELEKQNVQFPWEEITEFWTEKLYNSFGGYLESHGFGEIWNQEVDKA